MTISPIIVHSESKKNKICIIISPTHVRPRFPRSGQLPIRQETAHVAKALVPIAFPLRIIRQILIITSEFAPSSSNYLNLLLFTTYLQHFAQCLSL